MNEQCNLFSPFFGMLIWKKLLVYCFLSFARFKVWSEWTLLCSLFWFCKKWLWALEKGLHFACYFQLWKSYCLRKLHFCIFKFPKDVGWKPVPAMRRLGSTSWSKTTSAPGQHPTSLPFTFWQCFFLAILYAVVLFFLCLPIDRKQPPCLDNIQHFSVVTNVFSVIICVFLKKK